MTSRLTCPLILFALIVPANAEETPVRFSTEIAPVLKKNCVACHNESNDDGGVNLESVERMLGSDVDDLLVPGKPEASRLFLLASHAEEPVMPPEDNDVSAAPFSENELEKLRLWILQGALVDDAAMQDPATQKAESQWQPLPNSLKTVFASSMTDDGRLAAIAFGNDIRVFSAGSDQALATLNRVVGKEIRPAHDDFVQALNVQPDGKRIVSTGYRNLKIWDLQPFESIAVPEIQLDRYIAVAVNNTGSHLAALSPMGELSVAEVGLPRWNWMKGFELPAKIEAGSQDVHLAVDSIGHAVAVATGNRIRIVRIDSANVEQISVKAQVTSLTWLTDNQLATGHVDGSVTFWKQANDQRIEEIFNATDKPIKTLLAASGPDDRLIAADTTGRIASWNDSQNKFDVLGNLPAPATTIARLPGGNELLVVTQAGTIGKFQLNEKQFIEIAKSDPIASEIHQASQWKRMEREKLVAADESDLKRAETNVASEQKSLEALGKEIESKQNDRDAKEKELAEAKQASESASKKLADAKSTEQTANESRNELNASIAKLDVSIQELEKQLADLKQKRADSATRLAEIPAASDLADAVKKASEAAEKASQAATAKQSELEKATRALTSAQQTKSRGEQRLNDLNEEVARWKEVVEQSKAELDQRKAAEASAKSALDAAKATQDSLALLRSTGQFVTYGPETKQWSLWSSAGDWLAEVPGWTAEHELVAAGSESILLKHSDGRLAAFRPSQNLWTQTTTIGSPRGDSPFSDRVLCVDASPNGRLLVTGGGEPSRSGELMLWNADDGSLIRSIEKPHSDTVLCVKFSPDSTRLATGGADRLVKIWDVESGKLIKTLEGHTHHVTSIDWHVNRRQLASGSADETIKIWDIASGQASRTISGLKTEVTRLVYLGHEDRIGVTGGDGRFRVYRTDNGRQETNVVLPSGYLYALAADREGSQFVVGGAEGSAVRVDNTGKTLQTLKPPAELDSSDIKH